MHSIRVGAFVSLSALIVAGCGDAGPTEEEPIEASAAPLAKWGVTVLGPGFNPSLALGPNDVPAVAVGQGVADPGRNAGDTTPVVYRNDGNWRQGWGWTTDPVGVVPNHFQGNFMSLAFNGLTTQLVFSSRDKSHRDNPMTLWFGTSSPFGAGWQTGTFADDGWIWQAVQRVTGGTTRIAYPAPPPSQHQVRVATSQPGGGWATQTVSIPLALLNSLDFAVGDTGSGSPHLGIATTTLSGGSIPRGVHFVGSTDGGATWGTAVTIDDAWAMISPQIAFAGENPVITYTELDQNHAKIATTSDGGKTWDVEIIGTYDASPSTDVAIDPLTKEPVVAIFSVDSTNAKDRLEVARRDPSGNWTFELVDSVDHGTGVFFAVEPQIAVTSDGTVVLAWEACNVFTERCEIRFAWDDAGKVIGPGN